MADDSRGGNTMKHYFLQLFAEGGDGGAAADGAGSQASNLGSSQNPTGTGTAAGTEATAAEGTTAQVEETFESLIKGKYKKEFNESVKSAIDARFKSDRTHEENLKKLQPAIDILTEHYGLDAKSIDYEALAQKITNDATFFEREALEKGIPVDEYKRMRNLERENLRFREREEKVRIEQERRQEFEGIIKQVPDVQKLYPNFDIRTELQNPDFFRLVNAHVPVKTAYEVVHQAEIQPAAMQVVAQKTQEQLANSIKANQSRPNEVTIGAAGENTKIDISKLTKKDFIEYQKRVARGERITFK